MEAYEKIVIWFSKIRKNLIYSPLENIKNEFIYEINDGLFKVFTFGSFEEKLFSSLVDKIIVDINFKVVFIFKNGHEIDISLEVLREI